MAVEVHNAQSLIEKRENREGRLRAFVGETRVRVSDVAAQMEFHGKSPDEIVAAFPQLSLAQVHAALSYYYDHRQEIVDERRDDEGYAQRLRQQTGPGPLTDKRSDAAGNGDPVSS
ncbi:MAG: DUF433 domain-containing protein [Planctomycetota bacterium]|nr:MAG: DUF433 domain-containing protein [Planctomycetota bacterium]REJ97045.1 MAG: DUF433 domain-containing protein [Planctomycetota bacterium]REK20605.1 MAG: DUF433 domain-containing protein [Planctomycetota bacterium]